MRLCLLAVHALLLPSTVPVACLLCSVIGVFRSTPSFCLLGGTLVGSLPKLLSEGRTVISL